MNTLQKYFSDALRELHQVTWPTRQQAVRITVIVFIFMAVTAVVLGALDQLLSMGYRAILNR